MIGYSLGESSALFATRAWTERDVMHARLDASPLFRNELNGPCDAAQTRLAADPRRTCRLARGHYSRLAGSGASRARRTFRVLIC